ncbi:putative Heterokaryon incompatibility domain-containing protein [Seiridium cardinale]
MEHLIFDADSPDETRSAVSALSLNTDWASKTELIDFASPRTRWLDFHHDELPLGSLSNYPKTANFNESCLWTAKFRESREAFDELPGDEIGLQIAAFFQAWFFFGLLEGVVGKKFETSYFVRQNHLYTRNLHFCLQSKVFAIRAADEEIKARVNRDIQLDLRLVHRWVARFTVWSHSSFKPKVEAEYPGLSNHLEHIAPSIIRLGEAIEQMRLFALPGQDFMGTLSWQYPFGASENRRESLSTLGWCPFQIRFLQDTVNHSTMDWIVAIGLDQESVGHETCTENSCARNNIDNDTYEQAHVCEERQCQKLKPSLSDIMAVLERDEIPVVRLEKEGDMAWLTVAAMPKTKPQFVAISHVWADGLGGKSETGLNMCQIQRVGDLCTSVRKIQGRAWFWLDCLCIPRDCDKKVYYKALDSIKDVYKCASSVLVIDKTVERCSVSSPSELLYAHIYLSAWMQRMWTYEEAVLSSELVFVLRDGLHRYTTHT